MAQSVEQLIRNQQVAGSSPASSSILKRAASRNRLVALFTGFRPTFHRRSGAAFSFLSFFFRAASPVTRLPCFAFLFLPRQSLFRRKRFPFRPYLSLLLLLLLTSPASSSILKRAASRNRLVALFTGFRRKLLKARKLLKRPYGTRLSVRALNFYSLSKRYAVL